MDIKSKKSKSLSERIEELIIEFPEENSIQITNRLKSWDGLKENSVQRKVRKIKARMDLSSEKKSKWEVIVKDDRYNYIFKDDQDSDIRVPVTTIDNIFFAYSKHGRDLTREEVIQKFNISWPLFLRIQSIFNLNKNSNIFSPHTLETTPPEEIPQMIQNKKEEAIKTQWEIIHDNVEKAKAKHISKIIKQNSEERYLVNTLISELHKTLPEPQTVYVTKGEHSKSSPSSSYSIKVVISDVHLGLDISEDREDNTVNLPFTPKEYNVDVIKDRLSQIKERVKSIGAKNVDVYLLGDLIESFTGLNHKNTFHQLQKGMLYNNAIIAFYKLFKDFLQDIPNLRSVKGVPGNHDRFTASKEEDAFGGVAELIFFMLKETFKEVVDIDISSIYCKDNVEKNVMFLLTHGDLKATVGKKIHRNSKPKVKHLRTTSERFIRKELKGEMKEYTVVLQGHIHRRETFVDDDDLRWISCPPMCEPNYYAHREGYSSTTGYLILELENEEDSLPIVTDYSFK